MLERINSNNFLNSNFLSLEPVQHKILHLDSDFSLNSLREKSSINPWNSIYSWFTSCLKALWGFLCAIFCIRTSVIGEKNEVSVEKKEVPISSVISQVRMIINDLDFPLHFDKMMLYVRYGKEVFKKVFKEQEKSTILDKVIDWLDAQKPVEDFVSVAYVFHSESKKNIPLMSRSVAKENAKTLDSTFFGVTNLRRPAFISSIENDDDLLNKSLPELNKNYNCE